MEDRIWHAIPALVAVATLIWTIRKQNSATAEMKGAASQRLDDVEGDVQEIKDDQTEQWRAINKTGERVARLEGARHG